MAISVRVQKSLITRIPEKDYTDFRRGLHRLRDDYTDIKRIGICGIIFSNLCNQAGRG